MRPVVLPTRSLSYSCYTTNGSVDDALLLQGFFSVRELSV
jgi:hypothetical protein